jgi:NAD(P)-dependent dehydrogenase (short-subunit alcohol dehydrogenase family)
MLVTGSSGGIGAALKAAALGRGHDVTEFNRADFEAFSSGPNPPFPEGPFDALAFCTGTCPVKPAALTGDELFAETIRVNCGLFLSLMRHIVSRRLYSPGGFRAVAVSSVSAVEGWPGGAAYCASKGALSALCRALDAELAPKKISVCALEPRHVRTRMFFESAGRMGADPSAALDPADFALEILEKMKG